RCTTARAEATVHGRAAVRDASIVLCRALDEHRPGGEADVDGAASSPQVLAVTAPADPGDDRRGRESIAHRAAQASAGDFHQWPPRGAAPELAVDAPGPASAFGAGSRGLCRFGNDRPHW